MRAAASDDIREDRAWRFVDVCPQCGYSLAGSPDEGKCPECGAPYDQQVMILHGNGAGKRQHFGNMSERRLWITAIIEAYLIFLILRTNLGLLLPVLLGWLGFVSVLLWRRRSGHRPGLVHVYISPRGYRQVDEIRLPLALHPFALNLLLMLGALGIKILVDGGIEFVIVIGLVAAAVVLIYLLWRDIKYRSRANLLISLADGALEGQPWTGAEGFDCKIQKDGRVYLRIWRSGRGLAESESLVEIEFGCDPARQQHISALVYNWIVQAGKRREV